MIKINKTERKILTLAAGSRGGVVKTVQREGVESGGLRVIRSLRVKGLVVQVNNHTEWQSTFGFATLYLTTYDQITDEGRRALETFF